jgi:hypothetical protein
LFKSSYHFLAADVPGTPRLALVYGNDDTLMKGDENPQAAIHRFSRNAVSISMEMAPASTNASKHEPKGLKNSGPRV